MRSPGQGSDRDENLFWIVQKCGYTWEGKEHFTQSSQSHSSMRSLRGSDRENTEEEKDRERFTRSSRSHSSMTPRRGVNKQNTEESRKGGLPSRCVLCQFFFVSSVLNSLAQ